MSTYHSPDGVIVACGGAKVVDRQMFGPYRLEERIGQGGMGDVHRAFDTRRQRTVALKILRAELGADEDFRTRFRREALIAARLQEPHIVPIHDFGEIDGALYIDMRLVHGRDASDVLRQEGPMPVHRAAAVISQVADALDAAHSEGVVHRDVKPSNILLLPSGFAYLADFGIARAAIESTSALTATGSAIGTVAYMAPEQFVGSGIDHRVDVYALTCVFYELITGEPPFRGGSLLTLMHAHLNAVPPRAAATRPGIPPSIDEVIARGMAKQPGDRFTTAGEFARAVHGALAPATDSRPFTGSVGGAAPVRRRRGLVAVAVAAAVAVVVTVGVVVAVTTRGTDPDPTAQPLVGGGPTTTAVPTTTAGPTTSPTPAGARTEAADRELIAALDPAVVQGCVSVESDQFDVGVVASVRCLTPEADPTTYISIRRLASRKDLDDQLARDAQNATVGSGDYAQSCRDGALVDVWARGQVVCTPGQTYELRITWTFDEERVIALAEGDAAGFYGWWERQASIMR